MAAPDPRPSPQRVLRECRSCQSARISSRQRPSSTTGAAETAMVASGSRSGWISSVGVCLMRCL
jgi:hypothetical protein